MARARMLDEQQDDELLEEREDIVTEEDGDYLEDEEETLEELDVDDRGHVRPRRRRSDDEEIDPEY